MGDFRHALAPAAGLIGGAALTGIVLLSLRVSFGAAAIASVLYSWMELVEAER